MSRTLEDSSGRILLIDDNSATHQDFRKVFGPGLTCTVTLSASEAALFSAPIKSPTLPLFQLDCASQGQQGVELVRRALQEGFDAAQREILKGLGKRMHQQIRGLIDEMMLTEQRLLDERQGRAHRGALLTESVGRGHTRGSHRGAGSAGYSTGSRGSGARRGGTAPGKGRTRVTSPAAHG